MTCRSEISPVGTIQRTSLQRHLILPVILPMLFAVIPAVGQDAQIRHFSTDLEPADGGTAQAATLAEAYSSLVDYSDVLIIRNVNSPTSMTIADYFRSQRNITWAHVCNVSTSLNEHIDSTVFTTLANEVKACINALPLGTVINFLVTTKGVPLGTSRSPWEYSASVDSELALVGGTYEGQTGNFRWITNPYYNRFAPFTRARWGYYIVTRLTAFTVQETLGLVDRATEAIGRRGRFVFDVDPGKDGGGYQIGNDWMRNAVPILTAKGFDVVLDETSAFLTNYSNVAGYSSWGSNDGTWYSAVNGNSGFETDADMDGVPDGWFYEDAGGNANITRNSTIFSGGSWSLRIERPFVDSNETSVGENVSIIPERRYFLMGSVNRSAVAGGKGVFLRIKVLDSQDTLLATLNGSAQTGTANWAGMPQIIYEPMAGASKLRVSVVFAEANGTAFFDNIRLVEIRPHNEWVPGSLAETAVSTGGRTYTYGSGYGQSLVADLIRDGVTGVKGYVYEPYLDSIAHSDVLFDAYTRGFTLAESFMMASRLGLSWMDTIIGDPKVAPYNRSYLPDLAVSGADITFSNSIPQPGEVIDFNVDVHNIGHFPATNATVSFYLGDPRSGWTLLANTTVTVADNSSAATAIQFDTTGLSGWNSLCVFLDSPDEFYELDEGNNVACNSIGIATTRTLHLEPGRRFVSFPLIVANQSVERVLYSISGCYDYVRYYSNLDPANPWKVYVPGRAYNSLLRLDNTMGFWINMTAACDLSIDGAAPISTAIQLHSGWNMVGFPSMQAGYTVADLRAALGTPTLLVEAYDGGATPYYLQRMSDSAVMKTWDGYWIYVPSNFIWLAQG